ncbi:unnamed protein product [marine sediment metagenome]|uniref:Uncharacterized protein n=1 Tax=marine sediment metagenome TaxID=412755 RepID=X0ZTY1_9ZZZZ
MCWNSPLCVKEFWNVCVLEIRHPSKADEAELLQEWWECAKLGMDGDTSHQDWCEREVYGRGMTPDPHELRR